MTFAKRQRAQLLEKMRELGPFAETACEGWKTQDLAAHLWVREHKPAALPGIGLERFAARTARIQQNALHTQGYHQLLDALAKPSLLVRPVDPIVGAVEWYIHHEDVLRPRGEKVSLTDDEVKSLEKVALALAVKTQLGKDFRLVVTPTGSRSRSIGKGSRTVHVDGAANELLLHFTGRESEVTVTGDDVEDYLASLTGL